MKVFSRLLGQTLPPADGAAEQIPELDAMPATAVAGIAFRDADEAQRVAAKARLVELLDSGGATLVAIRGILSEDQLLEIAAQCRSESVAAAAIAGINDEERLGMLALRASSPALRRLAAEQVHSPALLARLIKEAQGKDKYVYRTLKAKRDALHAADRATAEAFAAIQTLGNTIERHSHQPYGESYASTVEFLARQWQATAATAPAELQAQVQAALQRCRSLIARHAEQAAALAAHGAALRAADTERGELLRAMMQLLASVYAATDPDIAESLTAFQRRWQLLAATRAPEKNELAAFEQLYTAIEAQSAFNREHGSVATLAADLTSDRTIVLRRALRHLPLLGDEVPAVAQAVVQALDSWEAARTAEREAAATAQRQAIGLLRKAQAALASGNSRQAAGIRHALESRLQAIETLPPGPAAQLQAFDAQLVTLQDWRSYAVAPKRTELIARMEALIGVTEAPQSLAERIHSLQEEWKLISKGNTEDTSAEWERFHGAAQQAYEPCKLWFAAQSELRAANLARRAALLERLQSFAAAQTWEHTDWRLVARALRESRQQWRSHQPVERAANKPLQQGFDALIADLQQRLNAEYARNTDAKRQLIAAAQRLTTIDDTRQAADEIKRLQQAWKDVGLVAQEVSQSLWDEFRQHCDAVFTHRQQQYAEQAAQQSVHQAGATALCEEAEGFASLSGSALVEAVRRLPALRAAFDAAGELPRDAARSLRLRMERAADRCQRLLQQQRTADLATAWDRVLEAGDCIRRYQLARVEKQPEENCAALRATAETLLASDIPWPKGGLQVLQSALAANGVADVAANETLLRSLCIRAELLTGAPTPEAELAFRRNYQLQELAKAFGQGRESNRDALPALLLQWAGVGATGDAVYTACMQRLTSCRRLAQSPGA